MANILVVEDNLDYQELIQTFLESDDHKVVVACNGMDAIDLFKDFKFDLILLDLMLPDIDGFGVCRVIRKTSDIPIVMLTSVDSEISQIKGFDLLVDDYIVKSVPMPILLRKVSAVLRRTSTSKPENISYQNIFLDLEGHTVKIGEKFVDFTLKEFEILLELVSNPGKVVTRKFLLSKLWDYKYYGDARIVDTHIKNIRKKLGDDDCIETVRGVGYKLQKTNN